MREKTEFHSSIQAIKPIIIAFFVTLVLLSSIASAGVFLKNGTDIIGDDPVRTILSDPNTTAGDYSITFFYNTHCGACHLAMTYLTEYSAAHPDVVISSYDLFNSSESKVLFERYKSEYHRSYVSVPSIFIGNIGLEGEQAIRENFDPLVSWYEKNQGNGTRTADTIMAKAKSRHTMISIPLAFIAGLVDGINPCASAVLVFLLILLINIREKKRMLLAGIVFSSAAFFIYFVSGVGIYTLAQTNGFVRVLTLIIGCITILAGLFLLKRTLTPEFGPSFIGQEAGEELQRRVSIMTIPLAFLLGLIIAIPELSCTGGIYLAILDMIAFKVNMIQGLVYLILYNIAFIIPLLALVFLVSWLKPEEQAAEDAHQLNSRHLFTGLLLLAFAMLILTGVL